MPSMRGAMAEDAVKPWQQKELARKEARLASSAKKHISPSSMANASPTNKDTKESKKTKFCMYHLQGVCMYTGDSCAFAHTVEEMQGARGGGRNERVKIGAKKEKEKGRDNLGLHPDLLTPSEFEPPFRLVASQPQPQPQPQEFLMPPPQGNVQYVQSSCIPDLGSVPWHKMDEPMYVTPSNLDNSIGRPNAAVEEQMRDMGWVLEPAQILSPFPGHLIGAR